MDIQQTMREFQRAGYVPELATAAGADGIRNASAGTMLAAGIPAAAISAAVLVQRAMARRIGGRG